LTCPQGTFYTEAGKPAKTVAYQKADGGGTLDHVVLTPGEPFPDSAPEVGAKYAEIAHATAGARIVLAGRRLAERMKGLLSPPGGPE
jgi:hypothetical protein